MAHDKQMVMTVLGVSDEGASVDLSKPVSEDFSEDDGPVSVRDALVFLEYASFTSPYSTPGSLVGNCKSGEPSVIYCRKFLPPEVPNYDENRTVILSHIESPKKFYIQMVR